MGKITTKTTYTLEAWTKYTLLCKVRAYRKDGRKTFTERGAI
ncbi:MAG: hypothetical protein ACLSHN_10355 [Eubacterium sp.]